MRARRYRTVKDGCFHFIADCASMWSQGGLFIGGSTRVDDSRRRHISGVLTTAQPERKGPSERIAPEHDSISIERETSTDSD